MNCSPYGQANGAVTFEIPQCPEAILIGGAHLKSVLAVRTLAWLRRHAGFDRDVVWVPADWQAWLESDSFVRFASPKQADWTSVHPGWLRIGVGLSPQESEGATSNGQAASLDHVACADVLEKASISAKLLAGPSSLQAVTPFFRQWPAQALKVVEVYSSDYLYSPTLSALRQRKHCLERHLATGQRLKLPVHSLLLCETPFDAALAKQLTDKHPKIHFYTPLVLLGALAYADMVVSDLREVALASTLLGKTEVDLLQESNIKPS